MLRALEKQGDCTGARTGDGVSGSEKTQESLPGFGKEQLGEWWCRVLKEREWEGGLVGRFGVGSQEFCLGHVKLHVLMKHHTSWWPSPRRVYSYRGGGPA